MFEMPEQRKRDVHREKETERKAEEKEERINRESRRK